jgi:hypothetical protein
MAILISEDSPLRKPPAELSRRQVLILDGIRYAAEMAHIANERLYAKLQSISATLDETRVRDSVEAMLDAWAIVDSAHRFRDLVESLPGLKNSPWRRILQDRTGDVAELRHCVQHQRKEIEGLITNGGQLWGYLSWADRQKGQYTGKWMMLTGGSHYAGDKWLFAGPAALPFPVPAGRVRLNAFGRQVYLGRTVKALEAAVSALAADIASGALRPIGPPALERRGADVVWALWREVLRSNK